MRIHRALLALCLTALVGTTGAAPASGAVTLGATFTPDELCAGDRTFLQTTSPLDSYRVPFTGVITSWSTQGGAAANLARLKVGRAAGGDSYSIVGQSPTRTIAPGGLSTFAERTAVQPGDVLGIWLGSPSDCYRIAAGFASASASGDLQPGAPTPFTPSSGGQFNISAVVEPDADGDAYGDETQDSCPKDPTIQTACLVPETTIDKRPKDLVKRGTVIFEFSTNVPSARFECSLDGPYEPCTSPTVYRRVHKGRHKFLVRAYDRFGVVDATPAVDRFKSKPKHRRK